MTPPLQEIFVYFINENTKEIEKIPLLDEKWKLEINFFPYIQLERSNIPEHLKNEYFSFLIKDLQFLLSLPFDKFWCQILYDSSLKNFLTSYLLSVSSLTEDDRIVNDELSKLVLSVCLRATVSEENKYVYMRKETTGCLLYTCKIFDTPQLLALCSIYEEVNLPPLKLLVSNLFEAQRLFLEDIILHFKKTVNDLKNLDFSEEKNLDFLKFVCNSIRSFLVVYPDGVILLNTEQLFQELPGYYEKILEAENCDSSFFKNCRTSILTCFQFIEHLVYIFPVLSSESQLSETQKLDISEKFISHIKELFSYSLFIREHNNCYPYSNFLLKFKSLTFISDNEKLLSLLSEVLSMFSLNNKGISTFDSENASISPEVEADELIMRQSEASAITDVVPVGSGFAILCLRYFDNDFEKTIHAILEDSLPNSLRMYDKNLDLTDLLRDERKAQQNSSAFFIKRDEVYYCEDDKLEPDNYNKSKLQYTRQKNKSQR
jgi:hypothetical protein